MSEFLYQLGLPAKDKISGFSGTITAKAAYLGDSNLYMITPESVPGKDFIKATWFNENRIEKL